MSASGHVWTAPWQELSDVDAALVGCGHVSGLLVRRMWPADCHHLARLTSSEAHCCVAMLVSLMGHSRPGHSAQVPADVRYTSVSDRIIAAQRNVAECHKQKSKGDEATGLDMN